MSKENSVAKHAPRSSMHEWFRKSAHRVSHVAGTAWAFTIAVTVVVIWAVSGPLFDYSNTWQLVINSTTTIVTFLMVFLIQNTQNRDALAIQLKLDELLRGVKGARTSLVDIEELSDEELERLHKQFERLHQVEERHLKAELEAGNE